MGAGASGVGRGSAGVDGRGPNGGRRVSSAVLARRRGNATNPLDHAGRRPVVSSAPSRTRPIAGPWLGRARRSYPPRRGPLAPKRAGPGAVRVAHYGRASGCASVPPGEPRGHGSHDARGARSAAGGSPCRILSDPGPPPSESGAATVIGAAAPGSSRKVGVERLVHPKGGPLQGSPYARDSGPLTVSLCLPAELVEPGPSGETVISIRDGVNVRCCRLARRHWVAREEAA